MLWPVSQAWCPPKCDCLAPVIPHGWPREQNSKASKKTGTSRRKKHVCLMPPSLWQPFCLLISIFRFLTSRQALFLRSLIITNSPQLLRWHAQQTAPFRILRNLWKWNTTRFSHWHHPASSDRSEMPVHVKLGDKKKLPLVFKLSQMLWRALTCKKMWFLVLTILGCWVFLYPF